MGTLFWIIVISILVIVLIFFGMFYVLSITGSPNKEIESINTIKKFLGMDFRDGFTIIEHISRNNHPDRPLNVTLQLSEESFNEVLEFIAKIESNTKETLSNDEKIKYVEHTIKQTECLIKEYKASHIYSSVSEYTFFIASLIIDYDKKTLTYKETSM